jgi:hypothetical protein
MARLSGFRLAVLAIVALAVGLGVPPAGELSACSKASPWGPFIHAQTLYFLGVGTSDSIAAPVPPGAMRPNYQTLESAEGLGVRGQVVEVIAPLERGDGGPGALVSGHDQAIVVWWDYTQACQPLLWSRSSILHAEPGVENVFEGTLLPPEQWVEGTPVIHAHRPYHTPFPGVEHRHVQRAVAAGRPAEEVERDHLSARELFEFLTRLPALADMSEIDHQSPEPVHTAILEWARDNPERWEARPVAAMVRNARDRVHAAAAALERVHPAAGTYRLEVQVHGETAEVCVRMVPSSVDHYPSDYEEYAPPAPFDASPAVAAFRIEAAAACDAPAETWREFGSPYGGVGRTAHIWIRWTAEGETAPGEAQVWRGAIIPGVFGPVLMETGAVEPDPSDGSILWWLGRGRDPATRPDISVGRVARSNPTTARFVLHDDGRMTVSDERADDEFVFRVAGERVAR